jgi:hypothetical protein
VAGEPSLVFIAICLAVDVVDWSEIQFHTRCPQCRQVMDGAKMITQKKMALKVFQVTWQVACQVAETQ